MEGRDQHKKRLQAKHVKMSSKLIKIIFFIDLGVCAVCRARFRVLKSVQSCSIVIFSTSKDNRTK